MRDQHEREVNEVATFLNSVPLLNGLTREEKMRLLDALEERTYQPGARIVSQVRPNQHATICWGSYAVAVKLREANRSSMPCAACNMPGTPELRSRCAIDEPRRCWPTYSRRRACCLHCPQKQSRR